LLIIDAVLSSLKDGKWHNLAEIAKKLALHEFRVEMIVSFLSDYGFIEFDRKRQKVKLNSLTREFINEIHGVEEEEVMRALSLQ
jgi:DNA-binding IclR family transcriptional regulator